MRRIRVAILLGIASALPVLAAQEAARPTAAGDWPMYNRDLRGTRHSPLTQITPANVSRLRQVWSFKMGAASSAGSITGGSEFTPLVVGGVILWIADHLAPRWKAIDDLTFGTATGIGVAQAIALVPGISRSGISISAGRFAGLDREAAARFAFLMATPITAGAILFEARKLITGESGVAVEAGPLVVGLIASLISGIVAIRFMLRYLRTRSLDIFVLYRFVLAAVVLIVWLAR